jgi:hypothetical protein
MIYTHNFILFNYINKQSNSCGNLTFEYGNIFIRIENLEWNYNSKIRFAKTSGNYRATMEIVTSESTVEENLVDDTKIWYAPRDNVIAPFGIRHVLHFAVWAEKNVPNSWRCYKTFTLPRGNCYSNFVRSAPVNFGGAKINIHLLATQGTRNEETHLGALKFESLDSSARTFVSWMFYSEVAIKSLSLQRLFDCAVTMKLWNTKILKNTKMYKLYAYKQYLSCKNRGSYLRYGVFFNNTDSYCPICKLLFDNVKSNIKKSQR